jgi:hypothetical protein
MATTTNYGWGTPDDTDLVKDGALAIRDLGQDIDTTTKALNPSTTLGDIEYRSATANTNTRLGIGTAGQVLQVNSGATAPEWATLAAGGGGKVLQVVTATSSSAISINSTTFTDTGLTATITPTLATSKILVLLTQSFAHSRSANETAVGWRLLKGATAVWSYDAPFAAQFQATGASATQQYGLLNMKYVDSPATTSATTYKTQGKVLTTANSGISDWQYGSGSTITLLEIGA